MSVGFLGDGLVTAGHVLTITEAYDICPVCFWEADPMQDRNPTYRGGANGPNLLEARAIFGEIGAMEPRFVSHVRPPLPHEIPPSD